MEIGEGAFTLVLVVFILEPPRKEISTQPITLSEGEEMLMPCPVPLWKVDEKIFSCLGRQITPQDHMFAKSPFVQK